MRGIDEILDELKARRDEVRVKLHLASKELQQEFEGLEEKWERFKAKAKLDRTAQDVAAALESLGEELKRGYERIRSAL